MKDSNPITFEKLAFAAANGNWEKINNYIDDYQFNNNYDYLSPLLLVCCHYGKTSIIKKLISTGADVNYIEDGGATSLECTLDGAVNGFCTLDALKLLLESGVNMNMQCHVDQYTALQLAITGNKKKHLKLLLEYGANPMLKSIDGENAFDTAFHYSNEASLELKTYKFVKSTGSKAMESERDKLGNVTR